MKIPENSKDEKEIIRKQLALLSDESQKACESDNDIILCELSKAMAEILTILATY